METRVHGAGPGSSRVRSPRALLQSANMRGSVWRKRVLAFLEAQGRALTPAELLQAMTLNGDPIHRPTLYRVVRDLEKGGLLYSEPRGARRAYGCRRDGGDGTGEAQAGGDSGLP